MKFDKKTFITISNDTRIAIADMSIEQTEEYIQQWQELEFEARTRVSAAKEGYSNKLSKLRQEERDALVDKDFEVSIESSRFDINIESTRRRKTPKKDSQKETVQQMAAQLGFDTDKVMNLFAGQAKAKAGGIKPSNKPKIETVKAAKTSEGAKKLTGISPERMAALKAKLKK